MKEDTWFFTYHHIPNEKWSLPRGFADELENQKINLIRKEVSDPNLMKMPTAEEIKIKRIRVVRIFYAGYNEKLNKSLVDFKKNFPNIILINELGDEPQTKKFN